MFLANSVLDNLTGLNTPAKVIISVAIMLFSGFLLTRLTKLAKLPNVTGYILAGIIIGPFVLNLIPDTVIEGTSFLSDIALAFIAFSTGEFFKIDVLKKNGGKVIVITILEALMASILIFVLSFFILKLSLTFSILLSALASATAPASTMMTIRQTKAKGDFVDTLLQVVALDDIVCLVLYSIAIAIANAGNNSEAGFNFARDILLPFGKTIGMLVLGGLFGVLLKLLMPESRSTDNKLIIGVATLFTFCGICAVIDTSPLLGCMAMGMVFTNIGGNPKFFRQMSYFSPPLLLLFFVRSGANFKLDALFRADGIGALGVPLFVVGLLYFIVRIIGKYSGSFTGGVITKKDKNVRNYLGLALIPQAGVAIGLAALGARTLGGTMGEDLETIILASSVLYELIGPGCAKLSLFLSKSYSKDIEDLTNVELVNEEGKPKTEVELLIERIQEIQKTIPPKEEVSPEEQAFTEASLENYYNPNESYYRNRKWRNRR
ncbi:MAG: cation:proton antiporter [Bacilli bacterium]|nr:cation:proton antiporter [Bacilli bacterium]